MIKGHAALSRRLAKIEAQLGDGGDGTILIAAGMRGLHQAIEQMRERRERPALALQGPRLEGTKALLADIERVKAMIAKRDQAELLASAKRHAEATGELSGGGDEDK